MFAAVFGYVDKWLDSIAGDGCVFIEKKLELADTLVPLWAIVERERKTP